MENKKQLYTKRAVRIAVSAVALTVIFILASMLSVHPDTLLEVTLHSFYNEEVDSLDYVVLGASASQCGIFPPTVYKESGIIGNDVCVNGGDAKIYLSMLKEILSRQTSPLIIVDMDGFTEYLTLEEEKEKYPASVFWLDSMKKNGNFVNTVIRVDKENAVEHFLPIIKYHKNLMKPLEYAGFTYYLYFKSETDPMKGGWFVDYDRLDSGEMKEIKFFGCSSGKEEIPDESEKLLVEFLDYCKEQKIPNVLFVDMPKAYTSNESRNEIDKIENRSEYCRQIVESYGYKVLNYNTSGNPASIANDDFADRKHLNNKGAVKFSKFLAGYLKDNYSFSEKSKETISAWDEIIKTAYEKYDLGK